MNKVITSREELLAASKSIAAGQGLAALNMRAVAAAANVAVGSVYNYFPSKAELVTATVQDIWRGIFHDAAAAPRAGISAPVWNGCLPASAPERRNIRTFCGPT